MTRELLWEPFRYKSHVWALFTDREKEQIIESRKDTKAIATKMDYLSNIRMELQDKIDDLEEALQEKKMTLTEAREAVRKVINMKQEIDYLIEVSSALDEEHADEFDYRASILKKAKARHSKALTDKRIDLFLTAAIPTTLLALIGFCIAYSSWPLALLVAIGGSIALWGSKVTKRLKQWTGA